MQKNDSIQFTKSNLLALSLGVIGVFMFITFQTFSVQPFSFLKSFVNEQKLISPKSNITPKLFKIKNNFSIHKSHSLVAQANAEGSYANASAYAAINFDSGEVIVSDNLNERLPIASLTKIMTAVVVLDLADESELFTVSKKAADQIPTKIGVVAGERMSVLELLNASLLTSANDATQVIADGIDNIYGKGTFISAMNEKAEILGLSNSSFSNPQGFDSGKNYSSVRDLAILSHYALANYPLIAQIAAKDYEFLPADGNHKQFDLNNWNGLIGVYPDTIGLKIGNTGEAGHTTVVLSAREGKKILALILGAPRIQDRDMWAAQVLDVGYQTAHDLQPLAITEEQFLEKYATWKYY